MHDPLSCQLALTDPAHEDCARALESRSLDLALAARDGLLTVEQLAVGWEWYLQILGPEVLREIAASWEETAAIAVMVRPASVRSDADRRAIERAVADRTRRLHADLEVQRLRRAYRYTVSTSADDGKVYFANLVTDLPGGGTRLHGGVAVLWCDHQCGLYSTRELEWSKLPARWAVEVECLMA